MSIIDRISSALNAAVRAVLLSPATARMRREVEIEYLRSLPDIPVPDEIESGVLLSDRIDHYATNYEMIDPYNPKKLKPAAYELSVGDLYSKGGQTHRLPPDTPENEIVIKPFEVVIIQTLERLNLPTFLIARWNVRVRWAYQGLLWVGAAQVDPGYKGFLSCPLYNLSDHPVTLRHGDEIAVIDFVPTTKPNSASKAYKPYERSRILFEDYEPDKLQSALATQARERLDTVEIAVRELRARIDAAITVITTAIGILVAGLAIFASRQVPEVLSKLSAMYWLPILAIVIAVLAYVHGLYRHLLRIT